MVTSFCPIPYRIYIKIWLWLANESYVFDMPVIFHDESEYWG